MERFEEYVRDMEVGALGGREARLEVEALSDTLYHVTATVEVDRDVEQKGWSLNVRPAFTGEFHWSPHLTPTDEHIVSDHVFRAPALIVASASRYVALIPDLDRRRESKNRWFLDLNARENRLTIGVSDYVVKEHVLFHKKEKTRFPAGKTTLAFYVLISEDLADLQNPWREPLAFMWNRWGKPLADRGEPLNRPLDPYSEHTYNWAFNSWKDSVWQEFEIDGRRVGAPGMIVTVAQSPNYTEPHSEREFRSIWNNAWFSSLRSAQGLYRYGRRTKNEAHVERARLTKELALSFPQTNGFFCSVIATEMEDVEIEGKSYRRSKGWDHRYFANSNRNPVTWDPRQSPRTLVDMSWTAYLMLTWYEELEKDERLLDYAARYADGLLSLQDDKGLFPTWITADEEPLGVLDESPGSSMSVTFLLKLHQLTGDARYKDAALEAMDTIVKEMIPIGRWEDYETYWSCSRWGSQDLVNRKVARNNMYKQNTLSMFWTAEALLNCYEETRDPRYLEMGRRTLDELLMTQAVWEPPYMHVKVFGGFGVMNADAEWNDARQSLFGELIIRYGKLLNHDEYVDRGVAAIKASFNMMYCPENPATKKQWEARFPFFNERDYGFMMENYGHAGYTGAAGEGIGEGKGVNLGVFTIYDWGNGAASEAYNRVVDHHGMEVFEVAPVAE